MSRLLPVHAPFEGLVIVTDGGVVSVPPLPFSTLTVMAVIAVRPMPSVTVRFRVCVALAAVVVSQLAAAVEPLTLWLESVAALSSLSRNWVSEPCGLPAAMLTVTPPLTVAPLTGLVIEAVSAGGGGPAAAPVATSGEAASFDTTMGGDVAGLPARSGAT